MSDFDAGFAKWHLDNVIASKFDDNFYHGSLREVSFSIKRKNGNGVHFEEVLHLNLLDKNIALGGVVDNDIQYTIHIEGLTVNRHFPFIAGIVSLYIGVLLAVCGVLVFVISFIKSGRKSTVIAPGSVDRGKKVSRKGNVEQREKRGE